MMRGVNMTLGPTACRDRRCVVVAMAGQRVTVGGVVPEKCVAVKMTGWPGGPTLILPSDMIEAPHKPQIR